MRGNHIIFDLDNTLYRSHVLPYGLYPDAISVLKTLYEQDILSLLSNGKLVTQWYKIIEVCGLSFVSCFKNIRIVSVEGEKLAALSELVNSPSLSPRKKCQVIVVGDRPDLEIKYANQLKCTSIRVRQGKYIDLKPKGRIEQATYTIGSLMELIPIAIKLRQ